MASATQLEFEKPIAELERQIEDIKKTAGDSQLSVAEAIEPLEKKLEDLREEVYRNLTPFQRVQVARNPRRPFTADYIRLAFTDFIELHGDRAFRDDAAIIGGWARLDDDTVMLIGHNPAIQELAVGLLADGSALASRKFPTGALATLTFSGSWWALESGQAELAAFVTPKELG